MTTVVTITTVEGENKNVSQIVVSKYAQKHVLRSFNPGAEKSNGTGQLVDDTKVLCAALIQQMIDLWGRPESNHATERACGNAIALIEAAQMQLVKANFVEA